MSLQPPPNYLKRIVVVLGLGVAFIVMASIFTPERSPAGSPRRTGDHARSPLQRQDGGAGANARSQAAIVSADAHDGLRSLGVIESGRYLIAIFATDVGPRYTIFDGESQQELGTLLTAAQVQQLLPDVDLSTLDFSSSSENQPLMLAEPLE
jgi:hypothetical protein